MKKREGQKNNFIEQHSLAVIIILSILAISILTAIVITVLPKSSPNQSTPAETSTIIQDLNNKNQETEEALSSPENQEENINDLIASYSETLSNDSSSTDDKYIAALQSSRLHNYQQDYDSSIAILTQSLNSSSLANPERYQLLAQLEYTFYLSGNETARIETINRILDLSDETDLLSYNTDISSVKENYQSILNQLQTQNGGPTNE